MSLGTSLQAALHRAAHERREFIPVPYATTAVCDNCYYPGLASVSAEAQTILLEGQVPSMARLPGETSPEAAMLSPAAPLSMSQVNREGWRKVSLKQILHAHSTKREEHRESRELLASP